MQNPYPEIQRIKEKLERLTEIDSERSVFGASAHQYRLRPTLSEEEVAVFESEHQIRLPEGHRAFLKEVSDGGAGPYYGLARLRDGIYPSFHEGDGEWIDLSKPFPLTEAWNMPFEGLTEQEADERDDEYFDDRWISGSLRLAHYGCGVYLNLIVNGSEYGHIWVDDRGSDQGIYPDPFFTTEKRLTFLEWYERWLDQSLEEVSGHSEQST